MKKILIIIIFMNHIYGECSDLDYNTCLQYPEYCEWNIQTNACQDISGGSENHFIEPSCIPFGQVEPIPYNTTDYANMCMEYLGIPPTIDCGEGVYIPIYVNGQEVFLDQPDGYCDDPDFKGTCKVGSRIGRVEGMDINGNPIPEVIWVYFCRSAGQEFFEDFGIVSVQMIGYNTDNGATCFFESPDAVNNNIQSNYLWFNENGLLDGSLPPFGTPEFDQVFHSPSVSGANCMSCHNSDPFIHDPWIDNAKLPNDLNETVVPKYEYDGIGLPYFAVGGYGSQFSNASVHIEGNNCLNCHRSSMELATNVFDANGNVIVDEFMPPYNPGSLLDDYNELIDCYIDGPENTQDCNWIIPPGGNCESEIIGLDYNNIYGDVNEDSYVNVLDIIQVINFILDNEYVENADLNIDGSNNVLDIIELVNIILSNEEIQSINLDSKKSKFYKNKLIDNMINKVHKINWN